MSEDPMKEASDEMLSAYSSPAVRFATALSMAQALIVQRAALTDCGFGPDMVTLWKRAEEWSAFVAAQAELAKSRGDVHE